MNPSARVRTISILLAVLAVGSMCLVPGSAAGGHSCCDEVCEATLQPGCCEGAPPLQSASYPSIPLLLADRVEYVAPRWITAAEKTSIGRETAAAIGIRTTVLRL